VCCLEVVLLSFSLTSLFIVVTYLFAPLSCSCISIPTHTHSLSLASFDLATVDGDYTFGSATLNTTTPALSFAAVASASPEEAEVARPVAPDLEDEPPPTSPVPPARVLAPPEPQEVEVECSSSPSSDEGELSQEEQSQAEESSLSALASVTPAPASAFASVDSQPLGGALGASGSGSLGGLGSAAFGGISLGEPGALGGLGSGSLGGLSAESVGGLGSAAFGGISLGEPGAIGGLGSGSLGGLSTESVGGLSSAAFGGISLGEPGAIGGLGSVSLGGLSAESPAALGEPLGGVPSSSLDVPASGSLFGAAGVGGFSFASGANSLGGEDTTSPRFVSDGLAAASPVAASAPRSPLTQEAGDLEDPSASTTLHDPLASPPHSADVQSTLPTALLGTPAQPPAPFSAAASSFSDTTTPTSSSLFGSSSFGDSAFSFQSAGAGLSAGKSTSEVSFGTASFLGAAAGAPTLGSLSSPVGVLHISEIDDEDGGADPVDAGVANQEETHDAPEDQPQQHPSALGSTGVASLFGSASSTSFSSSAVALPPVFQFDGETTESSEAGDPPVTQPHVPSTGVSGTKAIFGQSSLSFGQSGGGLVSTGLGEASEAPSSLPSLGSVSGSGSLFGQTSFSFVGGDVNAGSTIGGRLGSGDTEALFANVSCVCVCVCVCVYVCVCRCRCRCGCRCGYV
jgi:hypothetical protein